MPRDGNAIRELMATVVVREASPIAREWLEKMLLHGERGNGLIARPSIEARREKDSTARALPAPKRAAVRSKTWDGTQRLGGDEIPAIEGYCVYVIRGYSRDIAYIKIGYTSDASRFSSIRTEERRRRILSAIEHSPFFIMDGLTKGDALKIEADCHDLAGKIGRHSHGEWFVVSPDMERVFPQVMERLASGKDGVRPIYPGVRGTHLLQCDSEEKDDGRKHQRKNKV